MHLPQRERFYMREDEQQRPDRRRGDEGREREGSEERGGGIPGSSYNIVETFELCRLKQ